MNRRKTHNLKVLEGTREKLSDKPQPHGLPMKPAELEGSQADIWDHLVPRLAELGLATDLDQPMLEAMCYWWGEFVFWRDQRILDPWKRMNLTASAWKQFWTIASKFGVTPADREGLRARPAAAHPTAEFLK